MREVNPLEHPHARKPIALILTICVILLAGLWYYKHLPKTTTPPIAVTSSATPDLSISELQASVINSTIPNYSDIF
jgi:hypothetical protein